MTCYESAPFLLKKTKPTTAPLKKPPQLPTRSTEQAKSAKEPATSKPKGQKESKPEAGEEKTVETKPINPPNTTLKTRNVEKSGQTDVPSEESEASTLDTQAIGAVTNFYGSVSTVEIMSTPHPQESVEMKKEQPDTIPDPESPISRVESMVEIVSPPDISGEQIALTVAAEVPSYAPEKCIASQGVYTTEKPITSMDGPTTSTSGGVEFEIEGTEEVMATEQDVFGSPDEEDTPAIVHDNDTCEEPPNVQELATIEAEFIKATTSVKSEEKKSESRKRTSVNSDPSAKKRRVAHSSEPVLRQSVSIQHKPKVTSNFATAFDADAVYMGKKRTAKPNEKSYTAKRPVLPLTLNAKIPTKLRQRFLNAFIDEHLRITADTSKAYEKALSEEQQLFDRSSRQMIYLNLSTLALKRLREEAQRVIQERRDRSDARVAAALHYKKPKSVQSPTRKREIGTEGKPKSPGTVQSPTRKREIGTEGKPKSPGTVQSPTRKREMGTEGKVKKKRVDSTVPSKKVKNVQSSESDARDVSAEMLQIAESEKHHAVPSKKVKNVQSSTTSERDARDVSAEMFQIIESEKHHENVEHRLSPAVGSPPPFSPEKCKRMELKLTKCDVFSSNSGNSDDDTTIKKFYSHTKRKQTASSSAGQLSTIVSPSEEDKGEKRINHKIRKVDSKKINISTNRNLNTSVKVRDMEPEPTQNSPPSDMEPDVCILEGTDLEMELFGGSPDSDHGDCIVISSEDDEEQGTSFENALTRVDDYIRKPKSKLHGHKKKLPSSTTDKRHKKMKLPSVAHKSKSVRRRSSEQESMPHSFHSEVDLVCVSSSEDQRMASGAGPPTKQHLEELKMVKKPYSSQKVVSPSKVKSPPLSTPAESPECSLYQPPPGPLINLTKVAAQHSGKKTSHMSSSRKRSSGGDESKPHPHPPSKRAVVPSSENTPKASFTIFKKKEVVLTAPLFYSQMSTHVLTEEQLVENRYPRPTAEDGVAVIHWREGDVPPEIQPVGPNAMRHRCCRCNKQFIIYNSGQYQTVEECVYHYGRLVKSREYGEGVVSLYSCCQERRDSLGCQVAKMHVTSGPRPSHDSGYVQTLPPPPGRKDYQPSVYALDCEMCYTTAGLQLTRVSVVDIDLRPVYESLVRPSHPIVDYNTRFSGLTAEHFIGVEMTLEDVQQQLLQMIYNDTILLGHSLESDMRALKLVHSRVVDTAIVFPHRKGLPYKRALKTLMAEFLQRFIQDSADGGHDSLEDSRACMELMLWRVKSDLQKTTRRVSGER